MCVKEPDNPMKRWIALLLLLGLTGGLVAWRLYTKQQDAHAQAAARQAATKSALPVATAPAVLRDIVQTYVGVGTVESPNSVRLAPKVSGRLEYLQLREGAPVAMGQVVARIDPSQIQAQVSQQQAAVAEARSRLAQAQITQSPTNMNVATQIEQQQAALQSAQADASQVRQNYSAQVAAAQAAVTDAQGRIDSAAAAIGNAEAAIRSAQANLDNAQVRYNRTYDLYKQGFIAAQDVDDARTTLKVQVEAVGSANGQLKSAQAARDSATAQKASAQQQAEIVATKGKADIAAANAKVTQARSALKFARSNTAQQGAYVQNLAALRSAVAAAEAQLRNLQSQLSDTILTSPVNGFVTARFVDPGAIVSPSQPVITVQTLKSVFVTVNVPEDVSAKLRAMQEASVVLDALPGKRLNGRLTQISPAADPQSRQFLARVTLANEDGSVKPGMFARVSLVTARVPNAVVVPREAVRRSKAGITVAVVDSTGAVQNRPVEIGAEDPIGIQITSGVRAGETVVTLANAALKDGQKVKPSNEASPEGSAGGAAPAATGGAAPSGGGSSAAGSAVAPAGSAGGSAPAGAATPAGGR